MNLVNPFSHAILFDGDSTMKQLYEQVILVLKHRTCFSALLPSDLNNFRATNIDTKHLVKKSDWVIGFPKDFNSLQQYYRDRLSGKHKIIIWNHGLHLLHLFPVKGMENLFLTQNFDLWMKLVMESVPKSTRCVIFRTTNPIATSKFYSPYDKYAN